jgi:hypothetical protein
MPIQMFGSRISLTTLGRRADVLLVARLYDTSLFPRLRIVGLVERLVYFGVFVVMSRAWLVASRALINQRGSRNLDAAGHGGCWWGDTRLAEEYWRCEWDAARWEHS